MMTIEEDEHDDNVNKYMTVSCDTSTHAQN
jgi:hypothetical protein